jgi:hypothetical protein
MEPFTAWAVNIHDSNIAIPYMPLDAYPMSQVGSKSAVDPENMRVYAADWKAEKLLCLELDPQGGFKTLWSQPQKMFCFPSLFGDSGYRQVVGTHYDSNHGEQVVVRDATTGDEIVRSDWLDPQFNGSTVGPGFDGRFYYLAQTRQAVVELTPVPAPQRS